MGAFQRRSKFFEHVASPGCSGSGFGLGSVGRVLLRTLCGDDFGPGLCPGSGAAGILLFHSRGTMCLIPGSALHSCKYA